MSATTKQIMERARELVEAGWCQGKYEEIVEGETRYCLLGAIKRATHEIEDHSRRTLTVQQLEVCRIVKELLPRLCEIFIWNDHPGRTQAEVVALLRQAADSL